MKESVTKKVFDRDRFVLGFILIAWGFAKIITSHYTKTVEVKDDSNKEESVS